MNSRDYAENITVVFNGNTQVGILCMNNQEVNAFALKTGNTDFGTYGLEVELVVYMWQLDE